MRNYILTLHNGGYAKIPYSLDVPKIPVKYNIYNLNIVINV
jgi:hypothetical protein